MAKAGVYLTEDCLACAEGRSTPEVGTIGSGGGPQIQPPPPIIRETSDVTVRPMQPPVVVTPGTSALPSGTPSTNTALQPAAAAPAGIPASSHPWGQWVVVAFIALVVLLGVRPDRED